MNNLEEDNFQYCTDEVWEELEKVYRSYFDGVREKNFFNIYNIIFKASAFYGETKELLRYFQNFIENYMKENVIKITTIDTFNSTFRKFQTVFKDISDTMLFIGSEKITEMCYSAFAKAVDSTIYDNIMNQFITDFKSLIASSDDTIVKRLSEFIEILNILCKKGSPESERLVDICCERLNSYLQNDSEKIVGEIKDKGYGWEDYLKSIQVPMVSKVKALSKIKFDKEKKAELIKTYMISLLNYKIERPSWFISDSTEIANSPGIKEESSEENGKKSPKRNNEVGPVTHSHHHHHHHRGYDDDDEYYSEFDSGYSTSGYSYYTSSSSGSDSPVPVTPGPVVSEVPSADLNNNNDNNNNNNNNGIKGENGGNENNGENTEKDQKISIRDLLSSSLLIHLYTEKMMSFLTPCMMLFEYIFSDFERNISIKIFSRRILDKILKPSSVDSEENKTCITSNSLIPLKSMIILNLIDERDNVIKFIKLLFHDYNDYAISEDVDINSIQDKYINVFKESFNRFLGSNDEIGEELANFINFLLCGTLNHLMENVSELFSNSGSGNDRDSLSAGFNESNIFLNNILNIYDSCSNVFSLSYYTTIFKRISMNYILAKKHVVGIEDGEKAAELQSYYDKLLEYNILLEKMVGEHMSKSDNLQTVENGRKTVRMIEDIEKSIEICQYFNQYENKGLKTKGGFYIEPTIIRRNIWRDQLTVDIAEDVLKTPLKTDGEDLREYPLLGSILSLTEMFEEWYKKDPSGFISCNKDGFQHSIDVIQYQGWAKFGFNEEGSKQPILITAPITCGHIMIAIDDYERKRGVLIRNEKTGVKTAELRKLSRLPEKLFEGAFSSLFYARILKCSNKSPMEDDSIVYVNPALGTLASNGEIVVTFIDSIDFSDVADKKHEVVVIRASIQAMIMSHCKEVKCVPTADIITHVREKIRDLKGIEIEDASIKREIEEMIKKGNLERSGDNLNYVD